MMRLLFVLAMVLTATVVSAQETFETTSPQSVVKEVINFPYTELTEIRLWAPCSDTGVYQWWNLVREHQGPKWQRSGLSWEKVDDHVIERWIPGNAPLKAEERQPVEHRTIDVWKLRDEAMRELEAREPKPQRLQEPVYRVPRSPQVQENRLPEKTQPKKKEQPAPKVRENVRPSGRTYLVLQ